MHPVLRATLLVAPLLPLCALGPLAAAQETQTMAIRIPAPDAILKTLKPGHPRLLADAARFEQLKQAVKTDPLLKAWYAQVRAEAVRILSQPPSTYEIPDGLRLLATSRRVLDRVTDLAFLYRMEGDRKWLDRAWAELDAAAHFKDWNPRHFLDTAEMTNAFAMGYDWLYDGLTPEQRATIREAIIEKGLKAALPTYRLKNWWASARHNWNQVCNGGLGMGALAIGDEAPEVCGLILNEALRSLPLALRQYGPDGAWAEGPGYWQYATMYTVIILAGLDSALGTDFGLSDIPGLSLCGLFPIYASGPAGLSFSYADAHAGVVRAPEMWWLASRYRTPGTAWYAQNHSPGTVKDILWYNPTLDTRRPRNLPLAKRFRGAEVAMMRSAWDDPNAICLDVKAGDNKANHSHLDLGSFVLDALGVRWAEDIGADDYNMPAYFGNRRWTYYRLRAEGHNTIVYAPGQGPDQDPHAVAPIQTFRSRANFSAAVVNLTEAYRSSVSSAMRGLALVDRRRVLIQDEMHAPQPIDAWWFLHTGAAIEISPDGRLATLSKGDARLVARIVAPAGARFEDRPAAPLPTSPNPPMQNPNAGIRKLAIHLADAKDLLLVVELIPLRPNEELPAPRAVTPLDRW